jgi:NAD(P)-dependent dehydrogenase (short-subunit alcohol dehydrogenase family)
VAFYRADAASPSETEALVKFAMERFGRLDCLVNDAGWAEKAEQSLEPPSKDSIIRLPAGRRNLLRN